MWGGTNVVCEGFPEQFKGASTMEKGKEREKKNVFFFFCLSS